MENRAFSQPTAGIWSDEPGLLTSTGNGIPFEKILHALPENPASSTTGYVRAPVVPEIQANPMEVEILLTSSGSGLLDQDSTVTFQELGHSPHVSGNAIQTQRRGRCQTIGLMT